MEKKSIWFGFIGLTVISQSIFAETNSQMSAYFSDRIGQVEKVAAEKIETDVDQGIELQDINIDITPGISFGVSATVQLTISPEIDFVLVPTKL